MNPIFSGFVAGKRVNDMLLIKRDGRWFQLKTMARLQAESIKRS
ncbi:hypothetical protein JOD82_005425 [Paenibacillus sp. 1182]|nr:hypothetical protein [Paenibacillus sp. 1182]MBP1312280.1 hypothetical protein [Paenibacillus sp. 1182]